MKGKNFSTNNTGKRKKSDFYETPYSLTWLLLEHEKLDLIMKTCIEISNFVLDLVEKKLPEIEKRKENVLLSSNIQDHLDDAITAGKEGYKHQVSTIINNLRV